MTTAAIPVGNGPGEQGCHHYVSVFDPIPNRFHILPFEQLRTSCKIANYDHCTWNRPLQPGSKSRTEILARQKLLQIPQILLGKI